MLNQISFMILLPNENWIIMTLIIFELLYITYFSDQNKMLKLYKFGTWDKKNIFRASLRCIRVFI